MSRTPRFIVLLGFAAVMLAVPATLLAQTNQITLQDGINGWHFNGSGSRQISMIIPITYCSGGVCSMADGQASGTGEFQGSGTYSMTTPAINCTPNYCAGPLTLTVNANGSSTVNQTQPITLTYTSTAGTVTGLLQFSTISATNQHLQSTAPATFTATGGSFAQYFLAGGQVNFTIGLTFPLQELWAVHGFALAEILNGTIAPNVCLAFAINGAVATGNFAGISLENTNFVISSGNTLLNGNLGVGVDGNFNMSGGGTDNGTLYADPTAQVMLTGGSQVSGGTVRESMQPVQTAAIDLSNTAASLTPTQTFSQITQSMTITGDGGQNVISVTGTFNLQGGSTLTIVGGPSDTFIFNVPNGLTLGGGSNIVLSGVQPDVVLFNFPGSNGQVNTNGNSDTAGIFLAPNQSITVSGGVHSTEFISGRALTLQSGPHDTAPVCTQ